MSHANAKLIDLLLNTLPDNDANVDINESGTSEEPVADTSSEKEAEDEIQDVSGESSVKNETERKRNRIEAMKQCLGLVQSKKSEGEFDAQIGTKPVKYPKLEQLLNGPTKHSTDSDIAGSSGERIEGIVSDRSLFDLLRRCEPNSEIDEMEVNGTKNSTNSPAPPDPKPAPFMQLETDEVLCEESSWPRMTRQLANVRSDPHVVAEIDLTQEDSDDECQTILNAQKPPSRPRYNNVSPDRKFGNTFLNGERVIWIETSPKSGYVYLYARCGTSFRCICRNCEKIGRVSKLELIKVKNELKPSYEVDDHLPECRAGFVVASVITTPLPTNATFNNSVPSNPVVNPPSKTFSSSFPQNKVDAADDCPFTMANLLDKHMWNFGKFYDITVYQEIYLKSSRSNKGRKLVCDSLNGKYWKYTCDECKSGETVAVYSPNHKILLGYKYNEHTCGKVKRPENVIKKIEKKPFVPKTTSSELLPVTDDLWILPCNENNVAKHYFYIISSENNKYASKFILEEKKSGDLVYICEKCQLNGQTVYATINITAGHILVDAANNHIVDCFEVNLKKALKNESGILTNY